VKQIISRIVTLFLVVVFVAVSGGATIYSNFCKTENVFEQGFVKVKHTCTIEMVKKSCHDETPDESGCWDSDVKQEFVEQVNSPIQSFEIYLPEIALFDFLILPTTQEMNEYTFIGESPPLYKPPLVIELQQWLC